MRLGIDASNIRAGGGVTHLVELLRAVQPQDHGCEQVIVWGNSSTLGQIGHFPGLCKIQEPMLEKPLPIRLYWQRFILDRLVRKQGCDVLFVPGGSYSGMFRPFVTMSQNLLPFKAEEVRRYGVSRPALKLLLLRRAQLATFKRASGLIFLTKYACITVGKFLDGRTPKTALIPHGVNNCFRREPKLQKSISAYSHESPLHLLYVSHIEPYKHQSDVVEAVSTLREAGAPVILDLVGPLGNARRLFFKTMYRYDVRNEWVKYRGAVPFAQLHNVYQSADIFVYASSCENMPNILLEAMAAGLPIACSNKQPMPEILGDCGVYFDPESPTQIANAIKRLIDNPDLRELICRGAYERAKVFTWERCARETFSFLANIAASGGR
jgi:glycosyltransferase involved in cell wall biosynthesis